MPQKFVCAGEWLLKVTLVLRFGPKPWLWIDLEARTKLINYVCLSLVCNTIHCVWPLNLFQSPCPAMPAEMWLLESLPQLRVNIKQAQASLPSGKFTIWLSTTHLPCYFASNKAKVPGFGWKGRRIIIIYFIYVTQCISGHFCLLVSEIIFQVIHG